MRHGDTTPLDYSLVATRSDTVKETFGINGHVCVTNTGFEDTEGLAITAVVQTQVGGGEYTDYATRYVSTVHRPVLGPSEHHCYGFERTFTPVPDAQYRHVARVSITNYEGHEDTPFIIEEVRDFTLPTIPHIRHGNAWLASVELCPAGFTCGGGNTGPWRLSGSETLHFNSNLKNVSAECSAAFVLRNVAILTENRQQIRTDSAEVAVTTAACASPPPLRCTFMPSYWRTHPKAKAWRVKRLRLGTRSYTRAKLIKILSRPIRGKNKALRSLYRHLIAAKLNAAKGAFVPASVANAMNDTDLLLAERSVSGILDGNAIGGLISVLSRYNNGRAISGPPRCK
ncbi:MAG: hypothetical protein ACREV1_12535 [Gammaproteobacteria bacterium]